MFSLVMAWDWIGQKLYWTDTCRVSEGDIPLRKAFHIPIVKAALEQGNSTVLHIHSLKVGVADTSLEDVAGTHNRAWTTAVQLLS